MKIEELFETLDESVFTAELKQSLNEKFDEAVTEKAKVQAIVLADELIESRIEELDEKSKEYTDYLKEEAENQVSEYKTELSEKVSEFMDLVVTEFVEEAKEALGESLKAEHADMLIEAFDSMLVASGVEFTSIMEAKEDKDPLDKKRVDLLAKEVIELKEANAKLIKLGLINELSEGLTIVQADKFKRFADLVEFSNSPEYVEKLESILESVKETNVSSKEERLDESLDGKTSAIWSHLV